MTLAHIRAHLLLACLGAALAGCGGSEAPAPLAAPRLRLASV